MISNLSIGDDVRDVDSSAFLVGLTSPKTKIDLKNFFVSLFAKEL